MKFPADSDHPVGKEQHCVINSFIATRAVVSWYWKHFQFN